MRSVFTLVKLCSVICCFYCNSKVVGEVKDSLRKVNKQSRNLLITPYVAPTYTPELELLFTTGALISFKVQKNNPILERSSIPVSVGYSTNNSVSISMLPYIYGKNDKYRILMRFFYRDMPDNYWGVGYDAGERVSKANESTHYHRQWWSLEGKFIKKIKGNFFVGLTYDFNETNASMINNYMREDVYVNQYGTEISNVGLGVVVEMDKRDNVQNAYNGYLLSIAFAEYNKIINVSGYEFTKLTIDTRKYVPVSDRKTLAFQLKSIFTDDTVPWSDLPQLGTPFDLRGYQWGRYRDKTLVFGITEYRHMFGRKKLNRKGNFESPFGFVGWCGLGSVGDSYNKLNNWLINLGLGFRYEIQPRLNLRVDYGFGKDNSGLYISFSEAF